MRGGVITAQFGRLREVDGGLVEAADRAQHLRQVEMTIGVTAFKRERPPDELDRGVVAADRKRDEAEEVVSIGRTAVEGQHIAAEPFGLGDLPGGEMVCCRRKQVAGERARGGRRYERATVFAALAGRPPILA